MSKVSAYMDGLAGRACIHRYKNECQMCHSVGRGQSAHIVGRGRLSARNPLRFAARNQCCLCVDCHAYLTANPGEHDRFFRRFMGEEAYEQLLQDARRISKYESIDEMMAQYRAELRAG